MTCCPLAIQPCGSCQAVRWKRLVHNSDFRVFSCLFLLLFSSAVLYSSHYSVLKHRSISVVKNQLKLCLERPRIMKNVLIHMPWFLTPPLTSINNTEILAEVRDSSSDLCLKNICSLSVLHFDNRIKCLNFQKSSEPDVWSV